VIFGLEEVGRTSCWKKRNILMNTEYTAKWVFNGGLLYTFTLRAASIETLKSEVRRSQKSEVYSSCELELADSSYGTQQL
jgi:hypothetical protein